MNAHHLWAVLIHRNVLLEMSRSPEFLDFVNTQWPAEGKEPHTTTQRETRNYLLKRVTSGEIPFWPLVDFLQQSNRSELVSDLLKTSWHLEQFLGQLAQYYLTSYSKIHSPTLTPISIENVRVAIEPVTHKGVVGVCMDHIGFMKRLQSSPYTSISVVQGDSGIGKSTMMKKIAFDWANNYVNGENVEFPFCVVLAVPLNAVEHSDSFLPLAAGFIWKELKLPDFELTELVNLLTGLGDKLLIYFDGLDEYKGFKDSPFKILFAEPFGSRGSLRSRRKRPPFVQFKVIITSRPYASKTVNEEFFPLQFQMSPPDVSNMASFANTYCHTPQAVSRFLRYVEHNQVITAVTRMLTYVCHLANTKNEMPINLPLLYQHYTSDMVHRESGRITVTLVETVDGRNWLHSNVVKCAARLAYSGCRRQQYQFSKADIDRCHLPIDGNVCILLIQVIKESLEAHRSVQEFFAALYLYHRMMEDNATPQEMEQIIGEICDPASSVGRFFFGFCSNNHLFERLLEWLGPCIEDCRLLLFTGVDRLLLTVSKCLVDCKSPEKLKLANCFLNLLSKFESTVTDNRSLITWPVGQPLEKVDLDQTFADGLHMVFARTTQSGSTSAGWGIMSEKFGIAKLRLVTGKPWQEAPNQVQPANEVLVWQAAGLTVDDILSSIALLPTARTLVIRTATKCDSEVNFIIRYKNSFRSRGILRHLSFGYAEEAKDAYVAKFVSNSPKGCPSYIRVGQLYCGGLRSRMMWIPVKIRAEKRIEMLILDLLCLVFSTDIVTGSVLHSSHKQCSIQ